MTLKIHSSPGFSDVFSGILKIKLAVYLAHSDIRRRYRRSSLGPFWITLSTAIMIATIGVLFGRLFKSDISNFVPFIAAGLILWTFISTVINESCNVFPSSEPIIKQLPIPLFVHIERLIIRNLIIFFHNIVIFPLACLIVQKSLSWTFLISIPGLFILVLNLTWVALLVGIVCARYRDIPQIVASLLQIAFYVTPIIWQPSLLNARGGVFFLNTNPLFHWIELIRQPLLGGIPSVFNWSISVATALIGWLVTIYIYNKYKQRIAYWL